MKAKIKFDAAGLKKWGFEHGEKVAFGCVALVFLGFTYYAIRREVLDAAKQPEKLQAMASEVKARVANSKWNADQEKVHVIDFEKRAKRDDVQLGAFAMVVPFSRPLADPKVKREDPKLFNVEELRVSGGFGPFALQSEAAAAGKSVVPVRGGNAAAGRGGRSGNGFRPPAGAKLNAQAWAVVTALVPLDKQRKEYQRVFDRAVGEVKERDTPHYAGPLVERAEINDADPNKLDWKPLKDPTVFEATWAGTQPDVVDEAYFDANLTSPLGPLVGTDWGESAGHPKIPLAWAKAAPPTEPAPDANKPPEAKEGDKPAAESGGVISRRGSKPPAAEAKPEANANAAASPVTIGYKLFRVFDYAVAPDKRYRYRVKIALENPNYGVAMQHLRDPAAPRPQLRTTDEWSEPSDVVTIPNGNGVLAGGIKPQKNADPIRTKLLLTAIDNDKGIEAAVEQEFERGAVANVSGRKVRARDPRNDQVMEPTEINFKTDTLVLDIYGGRALSKKKDSQLSSPVEVLLLDANGHLIVHNELDDHPMYEHRKPPEETETSSTEKSNTVPGPEPAKKKPPRPKP